jgi:L-ascorbate metabolism protein UlaG (beta-lactamase superfamily)
VFGARAAGLRLERIQSSPRFIDGAFRNTTVVPPGLRPGTGFSTFTEFLLGGQRRTPPGPLPQQSPLAPWQRAPETGLRVTWLGHSTLLLEVDGVRILTDPVWGERASPSAFAGPKRFHPAPVSLSELPPLDAVLVSHDHYDHLDFPTIRELARRQVPFITALGVGAHLEAWGVSPERITELDWWEETRLADKGLSFTATPAQHFSGRGMGDRNRTLWASWVLKTDRHRLFFSGDTGLTADFNDIRERQGPFDLVMLEVGAFHPSWGDIHLGPENALQAYRMLGGKALLPIHWGTFNLAIHAWDEPAETLLRLSEGQGLRILTPRLGAPVEPSRVELPDPWWREVGERTSAPAPADASPPVGTTPAL